ncbi:hypothetical protein K4M64_004541 [Salmonella enterica]|nr:hypothetical protein [Salmonella enterica]
MSNENMYLPEDFNFFDLKDITDDERAFSPDVPAPVAIKKAMGAENVGADGGVVEDISDLSDLFDNEEQEELEAVEAADPNNNVTDLQTPQDPDAVDTFNDLPDDAPVIIGNRTLTKKEAAQALADIDAVKQEREVVAESAKNIDTIHRWLEQDFYAHQISIDSNIQRILREQNSGVSATRYGELARDLQTAYEEKAALTERVNARMRAVDMEREEATKNRIFNAERKLIQEIPDWTRIRSQVLNDAEKNMKLNLNELEKIWSPELAMVLYKASAFDRQKSKIHEAALARAKAKAPRSQASASNNPKSKTVDEAALKRSQLVNKMNNGGLDEREHSNMFNYLVD